MARESDEKGRPRLAKPAPPLANEVEEEDDEGRPPQRPYELTPRQRRYRWTKSMATVFAGARMGLWGVNFLLLLRRDELLLGLTNSPKLETVFQEIALYSAASHGAVATLAQAIVLDQCLRFLHRLLDPVPATGDGR